MPDYPVSFVVSFAMHGTSLIVVIIYLAYPEVGSHTLKVSIMFLINSVIMIALPFIVFVLSESAGQGTCFWIVVSILCFLGATIAISNAAVMAFMSVLPAEYMTICLTAFGVAGMT